MCAEMWVVVRGYEEPGGLPKLKEWNRSVFDGVCL